MAALEALPNGSYALGYEAPTRLLNANDRHGWRQQARLVQMWRGATFVHARNSGLHTCGVGPAIVRLTLPVRDRRRRDPMNYYPTMKAVVDGLVDAGLWPDDTPEFVKTTEPELHVGGRNVLIVLEPKP